MDAPDRRPSVLMILGDQHIADCLGVAGHEQVHTPNLDRLANDGVRFTNAYTQATICTPSRVSILSGQYPHNHGYYGNGGPVPRAPSLFEHFRANGYRTAAIGHPHVPGDPDDWLTGHLDLRAECYDDHNTYENANSPYFDYLAERGLTELEDSIRLPEFPGQQQLEGRPSALSFEDSIEGWSAGRAAEFITAEDDRPFFVQVAFPKPHQCFTPAQQFWDLYADDLEPPPTLFDSAAHRPPHFQAMVERMRRHQGLLDPKGYERVARRIWRGYLGSISHVDHAVGLLLDHLSAAGREADTIVFYGADHGGYMGHYGLLEKAPGICSQSVCRIPYIWRLPAPAGDRSRASVRDDLVENVDIAPTLSRLCGLPDFDTADGVDLSSVLAGQADSPRDVAVTENAWSKSMRWGDWRFVHYQSAMFDGDDVGELYDVRADPTESRNLYHSPDHQHVVAQARRRLLEWLIGSTRVVNCFPFVGPDGESLSEYGGDGKESNRSGPMRRKQAGMLTYL